MKATMCKSFTGPLTRFTIQFLSFHTTILHNRVFAFKNNLFTF